MKFGALSVHDGRVKLTWSVTIEAEQRRLDIGWAESGGPAIATPARQGFGARLITFVLPSQIRAETRIAYAPQGVHVHYTVPLPATV